MKKWDILRAVCFELCLNTSRMYYMKGGRGFGSVGGFAPSFTLDGLETLRAANRAIYRAWLAWCNERDRVKVGRLEAVAAKMMKRARETVATWGTSPAGGRCEIDERAACDAGALVLVCYDADNVPRRVDFSYYFGRGE